nr:hypothetical protein [Tanacetum cinerariifolium]
MKKLMLLGALALSVLAQPVFADEKPLKIGIEAAYPPFASKAPDGSIEVLAPLGAEIKPYSSQNEIYLDIGAGRLDGTVADATLLQDGFLNTDSGKGYAFVGPAFTDVNYFGD